MTGTRPIWRRGPIFSRVRSFPCCAPERITESTPWPRRSAERPTPGSRLSLPRAGSPATPMKTRPEWTAMQTGWRFGGPCEVMWGGGDPVQSHPGTGYDVRGDSVVRRGRVPGGAARVRAGHVHPDDPGSHHVAYRPRRTAHRPSRGRAQPLGFTTTRLPPRGHERRRGPVCLGRTRFSIAGPGIPGDGGPGLGP